MIIRLGVVRDFRAENWPSMDLCADQLLAHLHRVPDLKPVDLETPFRRRFQRLPLLGRSRFAFNADRVINRHVLLPRSLVRSAGSCDFVHVVDHSYAHVATVFPSGRTGVYCHDLDAFRSILEPEREPRPRWYRFLAQRTLEGFTRAAIVFYNSTAVWRELTAWGLVSPERLVHAPLGVADEFVAKAVSPVALPVALEGPFLLHVGSNIPRKRLDVLLEVFAAVRQQIPFLKLVQVGGPWPPPLAALIDRLGIGASVVQVRGLARASLAELYRRAAAVLVPSEAEGFGLPVVEALACGAAVVASDLPVLREVGGDAIDHVAVGDIPAWTETVLRLIRETPAFDRRSQRLAQAARYSWVEHAQIIGETYRRLAAGLPPQCESSS